MPRFAPTTALRTKAHGIVSTKYPLCLAACFLFVAATGCHNPVKKDEATKYLASPASAHNHALIIYRITPDPSQLDHHFVLSPTNMTLFVDKLLNDGYTDSTLSFPLSDNDWYCEKYRPGVYLLRGIRYDEKRPLLDIDRYWFTYIRARFRAPPNSAIYIGSFQQNSDQDWLIVNEFDAAAAMLKNMRPDHERPLSLALARWEGAPCD